MLIDKEKIREAKETLGRQNAELIANVLDVASYDRKNMRGLCPFHDEDTPSFVYNPKSFSFKCFGCGKNVDLIDAYMHTGMTYIEAVQKLFDDAKLQYSFGEHKVKTRREYRYPDPVEQGDRSIVYSYLASRKISSETADYLDIRQDQNGNMAFNYYNDNDVLMMVKYRPARKIGKTADGKKENKCWCQPGADTTPLLFNMNRVNPSQSLLITEGELDAAAAIEAGFTNVVSVPLGANNYGWIEENWNWLEQFDSIIICSDNDQAGAKMQSDVVPRLGGWRTKVAEIPPIYTDANGVERNLKDINELLYFGGKDAVLDMIYNAKDTPVPSLIDFSDIGDMNMYDIDGIRTGIAELDSCIMRLFYSTLTILSGTPGSGKTSFLYQIICSCMDQGKSCWLFSRELPQWMTKNWMNYILAGNRHLNEYETPEHSKYYRIDSDAKSQISDAYRGMLKIYKDEYPNDVASIKESMVDSARKYGCKLFIVDNLTTVDLDASDENRNGKQTAFVNWLIEFSMKYNVATILVCHPRKMQFVSENVGMYDISGTSNIINLAHRAIGLRRVRKEEKQGQLNRNGDGWYKKPNQYDVMLNIIKDRMLGKADRQIGLYYDVPSRRFFNQYDEFDYQYSWDHGKYEGRIPCEQLDREDEAFGTVGS